MKKQTVSEISYKDNFIAEIEIHYSHKVKPSEMLSVTVSKSAYDYFLQRWDQIDYRESFAVMHLSRSMKVLGITWISTGGISGTVIDCRMIFQAALLANASSIILAHNHPSGTLSPSTQDITITHKIKDAGKLLDIEVTDHIILTSEGFFSFADDGCF